MFASFSIFGLLPLAGFVAWLTLSGSSTDSRLAFVMACAVSGVALFILGFLKASIMYSSEMKINHFLRLLFSALIAPLSTCSDSSCSFICTAV